MSTSKPHLRQQAGYVVTEYTGMERELIVKRFERFNDALKYIEETYDQEEAIALSVDVLRDVNGFLTSAY